MRPWDVEEIAWARECAAAGDTVEEIAAAAERHVEDVAAQLAELRPMTANEREVASLYAAGLMPAEIDAARPVGAEAARKVIRRLRARGYAIPHRQPERLSIEDIDRLVRRLELDSKQALARLIGTPPGTATKWRERGLAAARVEGLAA